MAESPGVLLPGDSAQGLCQLMTTVLWIYTHLYIRQNNNNHNNNNTGVYPKCAPFLCVCLFVKRAAAHGCSRRRDLCAAEEGATTACSVASRAAVDRDGPGSSPAPLCAKECWARVAQRSTEPEHCQGGGGVLRDVRLGVGRRLSWMCGRRSGFSSAP